MTTDRPLKPGDHVLVEAVARLGAADSVALGLVPADPDHVPWRGQLLDPLWFRWQHAPGPDGEDGTAAKAMLDGIHLAVHGADAARHKFPNGCPDLVIEVQELVRQRDPARMVMDLVAARDEARAKVAALEAERERDAADVRRFVNELVAAKAAASAGAEVLEMNGALLAKNATLQGELDRLSELRDAAFAWRDRASIRIGQWSPSQDEELRTAVDAYRGGQKAPTDGPASTQSHQQAADGKTDAEAQRGSETAKCGAINFDIDGEPVECYLTRGHGLQHRSAPRQVGDGTKYTTWPIREPEPLPEWERELIDPPQWSRVIFEALNRAANMAAGQDLTGVKDWLVDGLGLREYEADRKALAKIRAALGDGA